MEFRSDEQIDSEPPRDDGGVCSTGCSNCPNCYHMMREIVELRTELGRLGETEKKKKKSFTIAPTMYTFYRNGLAKRHLARWVSVWLVMGRSASMTSSDILSSVDDNDTSYLENIIQQCSYPLPNPFFATSDFVNQYLFMCNEVCPCSYSTSSLGHILAAEHPVDADIVIGAPDSGLDAALGFSQASGIPYGIGLIKNKYIGRTFISPGQNQRMNQVRIKLSAVRASVEGKRVVLVDDSIVRGTTSGRIVNLLREAGAKEVHMRVAAPPFLNPCYYGTDIDSQENLIACHHTVEEIAQIIGADSLGYLPVERLGDLIDSQEYCSACFDGHYPTEIPTDTRKDRFERKLSESGK